MRVSLCRAYFWHVLLHFASGPRSFYHTDTTRRASHKDTTRRAHQGHMTLPGHGSNFRNQEACARTEVVPAILQMLPTKPILVAPERLAQWSFSSNLFFLKRPNA